MRTSLDSKETGLILGTLGFQGDWPDFGHAWIPRRLARFWARLDSKETGLILGKHRVLDSIQKSPHAFFWAKPKRSKFGWSLVAHKVEKWVQTSCSSGKTRVGLDALIPERYEPRLL